MKQLITLILIFLTTTLISISGEWKTVYNEGTLIQWDLGCADSMNCISLGEPSGSGTRLIKTTDGGYTWKIIYNNTGEIIYNDKGQWVDTKWPDFNTPRSLAYVTKDLVVVGRTEGQITISRDGGHTWEGIQLNTTQDISSVKFIDENYGIAFGGHKTLFKTIDSGQNWEAVNLDYFGDSYGTSEMSIELVGKDSMIVLIYNYRDQEHKFYTICRTIDGGETWYMGSKITQPFAYHSYFISMEEGWLVGRRDAGNNKYYDVIFYTSDGGHTWDSQLDSLVYPELGLASGIVYFADKNEGLAYGGGGKIWRTTDKGANWYLDNSYPFGANGVDHFTKLVFPNNNTSKIIANVMFLGDIWLYEDLTSVEDNANLENLFIYPNPASDFINISIDNDVDLLIREVQIVDLLGLVVSKQELRDGNNRIDISNLARGTYFIKVGERIEKFVKM